MKSFSQFLEITEQIKGVKTPQQIAKKHNVQLDYILNQIEKGEKVELEHTKNKNTAKKIALQHLDEFPNYYDKLIKMEKKMKVQMKEGTLHHWFKGSKSKDGKPGWVQSDGSPCANEPGETKTPKCFSSGRLSALKRKGKVGKNIISSAVRRKREEDPNQQDKSGSSKPTMVKTFAGGKANKHYVKAEPTLKEATKDIPGKGSGSKDACYYKVKSRFKVWPSAYACVPIDTSKALTKDGWKLYSELSVGEEILTYSLEKDILEFNPILNLFHYKNAPTYVVQNGNTGWKVECTPNHKWVIKYPKCKENVKRRKFTDLINDMRLVSIEDLLNESGSNRRLVISSQYDGGRPIFLEKMYKYGTNWIKYLLECSPEQRQSWLYSAIIYDGCQKKTQRILPQTNQTNEEYLYDSPTGKQSFGFKQKDIMHRDAFLTSAFLNKGILTFSKHKNYNIFNCNYISYNGSKSFENFKLIDRRNKDVWCPQTKNGTWVMMQETDGKGVITITGNSAALVKCRKVGASNWGNKSKNIKEEYTRLQETGNTYSILVSWRGIHRLIQIFVSGFRRPTKSEITNEVNKIYPDAKVLNYRPSVKDPTKPYFVFGEIK